VKIILIALLLVSFGVHANECAELGKCVEYVSKLTGKKYLYDSRAIKGGMQTSSNVEMNAQNADTLFTYILDMNGYARIPTAEKDTFLIVEARDMRYQAAPVVSTDTQTAPKLPQNYDYYLMNFKFKHFTHGQIRAAANSLRPFMSRYARTIELNVPGVLTIQETATKINSFYEMIKGFDRELTKEEMQKFAMEEKMRMEERREDRKDRKDHDNHKGEMRDDKKDEKKTEKKS
jgi:type II secretory pathway component GspD/PulD (secretin)